MSDMLQCRFLFGHKIGCFCRLFSEYTDLLLLVCFAIISVMFFASDFTLLDVYISVIVIVG